MSDFKEVAGETINRGEIFWYRYGASEGSEQSGSRPCVVVSNEKANTFGPTVTIVPFTTADKKKLPTHIYVESGISFSIALCEQVQTISKHRLSQYIGECTDEEMKGIERGLRIQLCLGEKASVPQKAVVAPAAPIVTHKEDAEREETKAKQDEIRELLIELAAERARTETYKGLYKDLLAEKIAR